ncbi:CpsD/CapB family tyrosine-protein kinase [Paenibacillus sp. GCM10023248]|uniref:CpsD/CapB family tyrosine-protein kinase n=1 Tax=Bacillales TaxID=1385 RepID=UPI002379C07E|nr:MULTISPECIES: CpsD/CapB family tyrosine-protein kinase [Bacillales]MDD9266548.1 CpsD/CapB family tyrosine-protein kinase [Paenibacillus sp. MAHUQ-63]MDR6878677.1 capsular exopolysaccharide synthesis family protein [Bacillus sp. 3255]
MPKPSTNSPSLMHMHLDSPISEAYRSLRFNIECSVFGREAKTITITSSSRGEGKTTTAVHLAVAYAQIGKNVLLLDADLRNPSVHLAFGESNAKGLTNYLVEHYTARELVKKTHIEHLSILTAGPVPQNPSGLLASKQMDTLLAELREEYDIIIVDTTSVLHITDAKIIATKSDGVLLIVEYGKVKRSVAKKVKEELQLANVKLIGVVLNEIKHNSAEAYM